MNKAAQFSEMMNNDGQKMTLGDRSIKEVLQDLGFSRTGSGSDVERWEVGTSETAIVICGAAWDLSAFTSAEIPQLSADQLADHFAAWGADRDLVDRLQSDDEDIRESAAEQARELAKFSWKG